MDRELLLESNPLLALGKVIFDRTDGLCVLGAGPGGIGVTNPKESDISLILIFHPNPWNNDIISPDFVEKCEVSVAAFQKHEWKRMDLKEVRKYAIAEGNGTTQKIAETVLGLSGNSWCISKENCEEAFDALMEWEEEACHCQDISQEFSGPVMG